MYRQALIDELRSSLRRGKNISAGAFFHLTVVERNLNRSDRFGYVFPAAWI
jgi:hypothetical protein